MASDGSEGEVFVRKLADAIYSGFPRWLSPDSIAWAETTEEVLESRVFRGLLVIIHTLTTGGNDTEYGVSGDLFLDCRVTLVINNPSRAGTDIPGDIAGEITEDEPSIAVADGFLRNALHKETLGGFVWTLDILESQVEPIEEPDGAIGRTYLIRGRKEVTRE